MNEKSNSQKWAEFRFSVVGGLLSSPPDSGELKSNFIKLSQKNWKHPISGDARKFHWGTIEY